MGQVEAGELNLLRAVDAELLQKPVIQRAVSLEFQSADGMGDALDGVGLPVGEIVHRIDLPGVAGAVVAGFEDAVEHRVAQVEVGRGHIDFGPQHPAALSEFPGPHPGEQVQILGDGAVAVGAFPARFGEGAAMFADFVKGQVVHIGRAPFNQRHGVLI